MESTRKAMRFRCARTIKYLCCLFIGTLLVVQLKFSMFPSHHLTDISSSIYNNESNGSDVRLTNTMMQLSPTVRQKSTVYHVGFLKVHKAGSTTMQNLIFRLSIRHNLTILLPRGGNYLLNKGSAMPLKKGNHYDTFGCHTVYSNSIFGLLPEDSVKIGIIRDPLERAISAAYYYRDVFGNSGLKRIPGDKFIENLVSFPDKFDAAQFSYTKNAMGKDFGFPPGLKNQNNKINAHMDHLKKEFKIVMVMERFEESLVLVKRELGWSMEDILFLKTNSHHHKSANLTHEQKVRFRDTCFLDYALYDGFYPIFEAKIATEGPDLQEEVSYFKSVLTNVKAFCDQGITNGSALQVDSSTWNEVFKVSKRDCELMTKDEIVFIKELRNRHNSMQK